MPITRNTNITNAIQNPMSRYTQGGLTDRYSSRLGFWDRYNLPKANTDFAIILDSRYHRRPDLLAYDVYQKANLQWFVLQFNAIVDINEEFVAGARITLPTPSRMQTAFLSKSTGGKIAS